MVRRCFKIYYKVMLPRIIYINHILSTNWFVLYKFLCAWKSWKQNQTIIKETHKLQNHDKYIGPFAIKISGI